jgi:hypothetical protein
LQRRFGTSLKNRHFLCQLSRVLGVGLFFGLADYPLKISKK